MVEVYLAGLFSRFDYGGHFVSLDRPALVTGYSRRESQDLKHKLRGRRTLDLASPYFAAEFTRDDLCSAEEVSPSHVRLSCIDSEGQLVTLEYRIRDGYAVELRKNGGHWYPYGPHEDMPANACATIETEIPKHDLTQLHKAYLDDSPSERCRTPTSSRRKAPATFTHQVLPRGHKYYEDGKLRPRGAPRSGYCRGVTLARLVLPPHVGLSQDLGLLFAQCNETCTAALNSKPNGAEVRCFEAGQVAAYQLGDDLYIIEDARVRRVPIACGVELDFRLRAFLGPLGLSE
ncbi:hypothetical protein [Polyangium mundeleinium]|uniref:FHA domain-containing protein n=1 Tax=Polyangium mundeleinium TaxID=2995306 RepID=A0ABT5EH61_9BACT|nr:hypothetical protein [Polyangium mundeleinium]MDC0741170.1 hypothetical protein [Polyangium mundeleinium]